MRRFVGGLILLASFWGLTPQLVLAQSQNSQLTVGATVPGPPPSSPPTIDEPLANTVFTEKQITLKGTCLDGLTVKVFRNNIFGGSALCQSDNTYSLTMDLFEDSNDLVTRQYDLLEQPSPDSDTVTVFYNPPQPVTTETTEETTAKFRLIIDYNYNFQGIFVDEPFNLPIHFIGGTEPYAVSVAWGDGSSDVFSREDNSQFYADHTYENPGAYTIEIRVSDASGDEAFLQFVLVVNGGITKAEPIPTGNGEKTDDNKVTVSWPAAVGTVVVAGGASFAAGFTVAVFWDKIPTAINQIRLKIRPPKP